MGTHPIFESDFDCLTETLFNEVWNTRVRGNYASIRHEKLQRKTRALHGDQSAVQHRRVRP